MLNPPYTDYDSYKIANPPGGSINSTYSIGAYPTVILIKPDKSIAEQDIWPINNSILRSKINQHGGIESDCDPVENYMLSLSAEPEEGGLLEGEGEYQAGETVEVSATANPGWAFLHWADTSGMEVSDEAIYTFEMPENDLELIAHFGMISYTLSLLADPEEGGEAAGGGDYYPGDDVEIQATAYEDWEFLYWSDLNDSIISEMETHTITMPDSALTLIANFRFITALDKQTSKSLFSLYPNPVRDQITLELDEQLIGQRFKLLDQSGKLHMSGLLNSQKQQLSMKGLPSGVYLLELPDSGLKPLKFIKK